MTRNLNVRGRLINPLLRSVTTTTISCRNVFLLVYNMQTCLLLVQTPSLMFEEAFSLQQTVFWTSFLNNHCTGQSIYPVTVKVIFVAAQPAI